MTEEPIYVTRARDLRHRASMTLVQLAVRAGISTGVLHKMETAEADDDLLLMGVDKFLKVADALDTTAASVYPRLRNKLGDTD